MPSDDPHAHERDGAVGEDSVGEDRCRARITTSQQHRQEQCLGVGARAEDDGLALVEELRG